MARRRLAWADTRYLDTVIDAGNEIDDLLAVLANVETKTVVRIIIDVWSSGTSTSETEFDNVMSLGIGVAAQEAFDVGVTALPDPNVVTDVPSRGWLYVAEKPVMQSLPTGGTPTAMWRQNAHFSEDLKAMRKIDRGVLYAYFRNTSLTTASSLILRGRIRCLCMT